jgi:hypothetical protein
MATTINNAAVEGATPLNKGEFRTRLVIPAVPTAGDERFWGFSYLSTDSRDAGIYFEIEDDEFSARVVDDSSAAGEQKVVLDFPAAWATAKKDYRITWGAGMARFYIDGTEVAVIPFVDMDLTKVELRTIIKNGNTDDMVADYIEYRSF